jgi:hypothetical protein
MKFVARCAFVMAISGASVPGHAQEVTETRVTQPSSGEASPVVRVQSPDRIFGVVPNYSTVDSAENLQPITTKQTFQMTALGTFDPYVFAFVGVTVGLGQGGAASYGTRYATALADNSIGNFMTSAVLPAVFHQDPRYMALRTGGFLRRATYAATRSAVTRSRSGQTEFNYSELGGNAIAAGVSNIYYAPVDRTVTGTVTRWGMQVLWDTVSNELKEFWPDIHQRMRRHK